MNAVKNIVLVHGAWADGSSWSAVIERLQADGYNVTAPQFPLTSLANDVARLRQVLARQEGPAIIAGHSYGGQILTALGADAPKVVGLVYIAAFGLDQGESIGALLAQGPPTPALAHLIIDKQGFAWLPEDDFVYHFAADVGGAAAVGRVRPPGRDGCSGVEVAAVLVPRGGWRSGDPARCGAPVREAHGCDERRSLVEPRPDGLPPG
jgi:pimeloyl-ACP methyl ester carboxylesterase